MRNIGQFWEKIDARVDSATKPLGRALLRHFTFFSAILFAALVALFIFQHWYYRTDFLASIIKNDLKTLHEALEKIDKECNILSLNNNAINLDFLTVEKFEGSVIAGLNLAYPKKWQGPYLHKDLTYQGIYYRLLKAKDGFYIVLSDGVVLPNGKEIGKDVIINPQVDVMPMLENGGALRFKEIELAIRVSFEIGDWDSAGQHKKAIQEIENLIQEVNEAMSFAQSMLDIHA